MARKLVYSFGGGAADGTADMKNLLGGKGANLAEMATLGIPVPAGFTITTEVCTLYYANNRKYPAELKAQVDKALARVEAVMGRKFGDPENALLVSCRSGARRSMPGMMETVLNIGLTPATIPGLIASTGNPRFVYDAYRRLIMMYSDVVMEKAAGIEPSGRDGIRLILEHELERMKHARGVTEDTQLTAQDLEALCGIFKAKIKEVLGTEFPDDAAAQLWGGIGAVFQSWMGKRAIAYRRIEGLSDDWGTAVNVQAMVFGNMGADSATGVAFTRNPATGEKLFYGEWLQNAQGEDVVAGIRTPSPINIATKTAGNQHLQSLEEANPEAYRQLDAIRTRLEKHYRDMQDIEFTIQQGVLWMLQTRTGKRNGTAAVRMAVEMYAERLIGLNEALMRVAPAQLNELLLPMIDPNAEKSAKVLAKGLPAGPGGATGKAVFTADDAEQWAARGEKVILVRAETSPEDVHGMHAAQAILTAKGGMTSHAALVARGWGKCCIVGCGALDIDARAKEMRVGGTVVREGEYITLNGTKGVVYLGRQELIAAEPERNEWYKKLMKLADKARRLGIRTNADRPEDAHQAVMFGAEGIGLCRTEHMFFDPQRIKAVRQMIVAETVEERRTALAKVLPYQREDFIGIFKAMEGRPVTIRLLDPPLHEFVALTADQARELAAELNVPVERLQARIAQLHELNPMLGHRGCRLGIAYPEITEMQARAIFEAAAELVREKQKVAPEVMVPLVGTIGELRHQERIIRSVAADVMKEKNVRFKYLVGTMIEVPRAALVADQIAGVAEFFSFGTNDLTQTTFGYSRDDVGGFLPAYLEQGILPKDPFASLDQEGVGQLIDAGIARGRAARKDLKVGICGEHGGDPDSIDFCHRAGMNYVSCSPFRVPLARLAAAQAAVREAEKAAAKKSGRKSAKKPAKKPAGKTARRTAAKRAKKSPRRK
ncbi:MAG TPA: pyruvate, phosphate dikinase [Planctomycetes bacterium]|nr:pyruvate, phosphate dikinase [Planctomycetota bacterium]